MTTKQNGFLQTLPNGRKEVEAWAKIPPIALQAPSCIITKWTSGQIETLIMQILVQLTCLQVNFETLLSLANSGFVVYTYVTRATPGTYKESLIDDLCAALYQLMRNILDAGPRMIITYDSKIEEQIATISPFIYTRHISEGREIVFIGNDFKLD